MSVLLLQFFAFPPSSPKTGLFNIFIIVSLLLYLPICCLDFRAAGPEYFNSLRANLGKEVSIVISSDYRTCSYFFESFSKPNSSSTPSVTDSKHSLYVPSHLKHGPALPCQLFTWEFLPRSSRIHSCNLTSTLGGLLPSLPSSLLPFLLPSSISLTLLLNPPPSWPAWCKFMVWFVWLPAKAVPTGTVKKKMIKVLFCQLLYKVEMGW